MNYDHFEKYLKNREVYSNELHVVLAKTPPKLFRFILLAIAGGLLIFVGFTFFIKTREFSVSNFVLNVHPDRGATITCVADEFNINKIAGSHSALVQISAADNGYQQKEIMITFDSLHITPVYELNGTLYDSPDAIKDKILTPGGFIRKYKVAIELDHLSAFHYFGVDLLPQAGTVKFRLGERRLINRFINI